MNNLFHFLNFSIFDYFLHDSLNRNDGRDFYNSFHNFLDEFGHLDNLLVDLENFENVIN
jgi:hypothetical protein